jgi:hypothetical protein
MLCGVNAASLRLPLTLQEHDSSAKTFLHITSRAWTSAKRRRQATARLSQSLACLLHATPALWYGAYERSQYDRLGITS